jgi:hypothetical protein
MFVHQRNAQSDVGDKLIISAMWTRSSAFLRRCRITNATRRARLHDDERKSNALITSLKAQRALAIYDAINTATHKALGAVAICACS